MAGKNETKNEKKENSKRMIGWDHPFVAMGFVPSHLLQELWQFSDSYWEKVAKKLGGGRNMGGVSWFHTSQLQAYICNPSPPQDEDSEKGET